MIDGKTICQVALVVRDVKATAKAYADLFDMPMPEIVQVPLPEIAHTEVRGKPSKTRAQIAVFRLGQIVLELTQPDEEPSSWKEFLETHGEGVHHIAFMTEDRDKVVQYFAEQNMPVRHYGEYPGGNYTVFDCAELFKVLIQVKAKT